MRQLYIVLTIFYAVNCFAQEADQRLFRTWFLTSVQETDMNPVYLIENVDPAIYPFLNISEDLSFFGEGACNTFEGIYINPEINNLEVGEYSQTLADCNFNIHNTIENSYFNLIQVAGSYQITEIDGNLTLAFFSPLGGSAIFSSQPLNTSEFTIDNIIIYPNPTSASIGLNTENLTIEKVEFYNSFGQKIISFYENFKTMDISDFSSGVYLMRIYSEKRQLVKKILKI